MNTLFIDTHSALITVALDINGVIVKKEKLSEKSHSIYFVPMIRDILKENNLTTRDINKIVAINGPGSFTGLRIGLSVSKTLAYLLNIPIYLVSSLTSYLISSDIIDKKKAVIDESHGYYISIFDKDNNSILDECFLENIDQFSSIKEVENTLNIKKILDYSLNIKATDANLVRANYVKKIEVEK